MPPKIKTEKKQIISTSLAMAKTKGWEQLTTREIARALNCSTHPILRVFETMSDLKSTVWEQAWLEYNSYLANFKYDGDKKGLAFGIVYINFAREEKNLFKLFFMSSLWTIKILIP